MTKPSDFARTEAIEVKNAGDALSLNRRIWTLRLVGGTVLAASWLAVSLHDLGSTHFIIDATVFGVLGAFGFVAAAASRRVAVNLERKLRLRLLVHNMELETMATRDDLTQLFNRRYLFDRLERELQTAKGLQRSLALITIDLDSFQSVNDTYGHRMGDKALASFGRFLLNHTRATDVPARIGGDKFAVILPDTSKRGACTMLERLARGLEKTALIEEDGLVLRLTASLGISGYPWGADTVDGIIQHAEASVLANKQARRRGCSEDEEGAVPAVFRRTSETMDDDPSDLGVPPP